MKRLHLLSTVAAAVLFAAGSAAAQGLQAQPGGGGNAAPPAQQRAPAGKIAPSMHAGHRHAPQTTGEGASHNGMRGTDKGMAHQGMPPSEHGGPSGIQNGNAGKGRQGGATTGQGAAASAAKLTTKQRSKITTIIKWKKVEPAHLNISVHIGARVPRHVHFYALPEQVVTIYPEWRGYDYILVGDQIVVIDPDSDEIVAILET